MVRFACPAEGSLSGRPCSCASARKGRPTQRLPRPSRWLLCSCSGNDQHLGNVREFRALQGSRHYARHARRRGRAGLAPGPIAGSRARVGTGGSRRLQQRDVDAARGRFSGEGATNARACRLRILCAAYERRSTRSSCLVDVSRCGGQGSSTGRTSGGCPDSLRFLDDRTSTRLRAASLPREWDRETMTWGGPGDGSVAGCLAGGGVSVFWSRARSRRRSLSPRRPQRVSLRDVRPPRPPRPRRRWTIERWASHGSRTADLGASLDMSGVCRL